VVKVIAQKATVHGRFSRIHQAVPMWPPCNTCFIRCIRVHNPNGISTGSAIFAQLIAVSLYHTLQHNRPPLPPSKLPLPIGVSGSHLIHGSLSPQPKWHLDRFSRFCRAHNCDRQTTPLCL